MLCICSHARTYQLAHHQLRLCVDQALVSLESLERVILARTQTHTSVGTHPSGYRLSVDCASVPCDLPLVILCMCNLEL